MRTVVRCPGNLAATEHVWTADEIQTVKNGHVGSIGEGVRIFDQGSAGWKPVEGGK